MPKIKKKMIRSTNLNKHMSEYMKLQNKTGKKKNTIAKKKDQQKKKN